MSEHVHVIASGRVQGVFYRLSTRNKAKSLGLCGWVKNLDTGDVEAVIEGEADKISEMLNWMRQGPENARVDDLRITRGLEPTGRDGFHIRY